MAGDGFRGFVIQSQICAFAAAPMRACAWASTRAYFGCMLPTPKHEISHALLHTAVLSLLTIVWYPPRSYLHLSLP
eukprot:3877340-Pleurochrysis_carterae.AAC.2